jgi:ABC-type multidrug transport system fused ATPase/permease subunit
VLDDLNLVIEARRARRLVGRSGAGKSTLVNLLLRFHDLEQGSILHRRPGHPRGHAGEPARARSAW